MSSDVSFFDWLSQNPICNGAFVLFLVAIVGEVMFKIVFAIFKFSDDDDESEEE